MSAGGTGGHLFPALALAEELEGYEILFVASGLSQSRFFNHAYPFEEIASATFSLSKPLSILKGIPPILKGVKKSWEIIHSFEPDAVVGFGSYHTLPLLLAATLSKIPLILHEQNAIPGKVNRLFSPFAHTTAITFPLQMRGKLRPVSFPLRKCPQIDPWNYFGLEKGRTTLLVFGGSQGAVRLNALFVEALPYLKNYQVLHFTGKEEPGIKARYEELAIAHVVRIFEPHVPLAMTIADLAITRAGAATLAELTANQLPAILIPFPHASENHQEKNASYFLGGECYLERELTGKKLAEAIRSFPIEQKKQKIEKNHHIALREVIHEVIHT